MMLPWFKMPNEFYLSHKVKALSEVMRYRLSVLLHLHYTGQLDELADDEIRAALCLNRSAWEKTKAIFIDRGFFDSEIRLLDWHMQLPMEAAEEAESGARVCGKSGMDWLADETRPLDWEESFQPTENDIKGH